MFRIKLSEQGGGFYHEAYFTDLPTKKDVEASVIREAEIAGENYSYFYDQCLRAVNKFEWPERWSGYMSETGALSNAETYIRIKKCQVISNGKETQKA